MKKTLTINLGGTVFHIDEDAYELLDKYLFNLRIHFKHEEGSEEIMDDFEMRISELLNERIRLGYGVITITEIENVIKRMGSPEELFEGSAEENKQQAEQSAYPNGTFTYTHKRLFRNPDDKILGGVAGGGNRSLSGLGSDTGQAFNYITDNRIRRFSLFCNLFHYVDHCSNGTYGN